MVSVIYFKRVSLILYDPVCECCITKGVLDIAEFCTNFVQLSQKDRLKLY